MKAGDEGVQLESVSWRLFSLESARHHADSGAD
jgi:hypothetical protein